MSLLDDDTIKEDKKAAHDRRAMPGEEIDRVGVSWVKEYENLLSEEEMEWSKKTRGHFEQKFVDFPNSWWPEMNTRDQERLQLDQVVQDDVAKGAYDDTWSVRDNHENPALSQFPGKLAKQILRMWSLQNDKVFDPFAGHLSRPILTNHFDRDYWGCDVSKQFFDETRNKILSRCEGGLLEDDVILDEEELIEVVLRDNFLRLERRDSRTVGERYTFEDGTIAEPIPDKWADFIITSPPYFDLEDYGDEPEQLGKANEEFEDFMDDMEIILEECYRILKPYRYATFVVNDFRDKCRYHGMTDYHNALIEKAKEAGFQLHDIAMYPTGKSASMFTEQLVTMEVTGKIHEYIITLRRWPDEWEEASTSWDWKYRGLHWDCYPAEKIISYYGIDRFTEWIQARVDRDLDISRWVKNDGSINWEGHPKHREDIKEHNNHNVKEDIDDFPR